MNVDRSTRLCAAALCAILIGAPPSRAQLLGGPPVGGVLGAAAGAVERPLERLPGAVEDATGTMGEGLGQGLAAARRLAAARLIHEHPKEIEADDRGRPVVRGEVLALSPAPEALERARHAGFTLGESISAPELGLNGVVLRAPPGLSARAAVKRLRRLDPAGRYDFDHLYQEGGATMAGGSSAALPPGRRIRVGLVDGSVAADHPALRGAHIRQQPFAPGGAKVSAHATAVASLLAGDQGAFHGGAPGAEVLVADVYGPTPAGGSAAAIARGLAWLAQNRVGVINISLVGPPNLLLDAAVRGLSARGVLLVAAVGNDGPAAAPLYPAAYPDVIAVTAVDARRHVLPEAGRGAYVAFAAPGAQMAAAGVGGGFVSVRGTSFAAPIVAAALAAELPSPDPAQAKAALQRLAARAEDLGARGRDAVYGFGLVGFERRVDPAEVGARGRSLAGP